MARPSDLTRARMISVGAATTIALACGSNYVYSAWSPQFAQKLKLSSTESNLIGTAGNLGMYASGIPVGMLVDSKGPHYGVALGAVLLGGGYYPIAKAYDAGPGVFHVAVLCLFSFCTGCGSAAAFTAAIKASALNFPESRGTATAFPLSAFGLSAFFFSTISTLLFADDTYAFLLVLATGTCALPVLSFFFLRVLPPQPSHKIADQQSLQQRKSSEEQNRRSQGESQHACPPDAVEGLNEDGEDASLLSKDSAVGEDLETSKRRPPVTGHGAPHVDVRGWALLPHPEFWHLFWMLGLLTGIGLQTINNIGSDAQALWKHFDNLSDPTFIQQRQVMHVQILSFCSFLGRLTSGIGSDLLVAKLNKSRFWCLFVSAIVFCIAQLLATMIENPNFLVFVSGLTGLAYGILFGVYPSLVAHTFGAAGLAQNWGTMTLAPVVCGNIFNLLYGQVYDSHSVVGPDGSRECLEGRYCYSAAYWTTFGASIGGIALCLWSIWHENKIHKLKTIESRRSDHERSA